MWHFRKRRASVDEIETDARSHSPELLNWCQWANFSSTYHLNLIDYDGKKRYGESLPWYHIPFTTKDMLRFCEASVFQIYKHNFRTHLSTCDQRQIPTLIKKMLRVCELYKIPYNGDEAANLYSDIVNSLFDKDCNDPDLLISVWNVLCGQSDLAKLEVFRSRDSSSSHLRRKSVKILKYILKNAQIMHFDFWGVWIKGPENKFPYCPVTSALVSGNVEKMTVLLQYGFQQNLERIATYDGYFLDLDNGAYTWLKKTLEKQKNKRRAILTEVLLFLVQAARCRTEFARLNKCFHLFWSFTSAPFVTKSELRAEVKHRFRKPPHCNATSVFPYKKTQFLRLCELYDWVLLPEETMQIVEPRALQHLCKCAVRMALVVGWNLPDGIKDLPIPSSLQAYINVRA